MYFPSWPITALRFIWIMLSSVLARRITRRPLTGALLTAVLASSWPFVLHRLERQRWYPSIIRFSAHGPRVASGLLPSRGGHGEAAERQSFIDRFGFDPREEPRELVHLRRVIPIGQSLDIEDGQLTILSIESYEEGFLVHSRLLTERSSPTGRFEPFAEHSFPSLLRASVQDDRGHVYPLMPGGGGGSDREYRFETRSQEALDPHAQSLVITVPSIVWETFRPMQQERPTERVVEGPWTFELDL